MLFGEEIMKNFKISNKISNKLSNNKRYDVVWVKNNVKI